MIYIIFLKMNISEIVKKHLPEYKVTDATNRSTTELMKICKIIKYIPKLITFIRRTPKNSSFFNFYRWKMNIVKPIDIMFIYGDTVKLFETNNVEQDIKGIVRLIANCIAAGDTSCVICLEKTGEVLYCTVCGNDCCESCVRKMLSITNKMVSCPLCKSYELTFKKNLSVS